MVSDADKRRRIAAILRCLGIYTPERATAVLALDDTSVPSPIQGMAKLGFTFADGATNRALLDEVANRLRRGRLDREYRDYIQLPLREVGILGRATADPTNGVFIANYWRPKSNHCVSVLTEEFRELLHADPGVFDEALDEWLGTTEIRVARMAAAESRAWEELEDDRLVTQVIKTYCADLLSDYEVIFVDDRDLGERIADEYKENVVRYRIPLGLHTRWPDIILRHSKTGSFWIVDAVENDGEIDSIRKDEIREEFDKAGLVIDGYTTAFRTLKRFRERQATHDNIALDTYTWIAEVGGAHWHKTRRLL